MAGGQGWEQAVEEGEEAMPEREHMAVLLCLAPEYPFLLGKLLHAGFGPSLGMCHHGSPIPMQPPGLAAEQTLLQALCPSPGLPGLDPSPC